MGSHALAPPLQLAVPAARVRLVLATLAVLAFGALGVALALSLPSAQPSPPAQFQGDIAAP